MFVHATRFRVLGPCPVADGIGPTHARMSAHQLRRFQGTLVYWCAGCGAAHVSAKAALRLDGDRAPDGDAV